MIASTPDERRSESNGSRPFVNEAPHAAIYLGSNTIRLEHHLGSNTGGGTGGSTRLAGHAERLKDPGLRGGSLAHARGAFHALQRDAAERW
jgi:hypothetical protein